ncbi:MAG: acetyl-CoA carboxylase biotin carboxyl carrier protein [Verrucomicrobia subdivision 3 bacterium]|nr:acetyl-CoA carboxylase biotin carboxyl carrier protein [Limisphaerales bacterium]
MATGRNGVDLKDIKAIIDLMKKNSISEFELERQDFKIRLKRGGVNPTSAVAYEEPQVQTYIPGGVPLTPSVSGALPVVPVAGEMEIKAPMIGTFYRAPSPEAANYVDVGTEVNPDAVVCIIEAMKVMNEIKAEVKGVVTQILVENAKPVEFGQPMFKIRPI